MINFTDYDRITDTVMYINNYDESINKAFMTLEFTVLLSKPNKAKERKFFHSEILTTSKYIGTMESRSIRRNLTYFFSIKTKENFMGIALRPGNVATLLMLIEQKIFPWFFDPNNSVFSTNDNKAIVLGEHIEVYAPSDLTYLAFEARVINYQDGKFGQGIRLYLQKEFVDIDINKFMEFYYILKNTDMYSAACAMINYVKIPPYGIEVFNTGKGLGSAKYQDQSFIDTDWNNNTSSTGNYQRGTVNNFLNNSKSKRRE